MNCLRIPKKIIHLLAGIWLAMLGGAPARSGAQSVSNGFWQAQSIYQIVTDRFFDGDAANNNADGNYNAAGTTSVHGGDFKGVEQKLDYIKALGATALWISPVVLNGHGQFHGYAARDFYHVDPHWGSLADLQHLVQTAHAKGLLVIDDVVCNHGDDLISSSDSGYCNYLAPPAGYHLKYSGTTTYAPPFDTYNATYTFGNNALTNLFHNQGCIANFSDTNQVQLGELSGLDDFRTESAYVRSNLTAIYQYWIQQVGFDGFRVDTVKHVDQGFWQSWCPPVHAFAATNARPNFFMFGEVFDTNETLCGSFTGTKGGGPFELDSVLDYPLYFILNSVFATGGGATSQIETHYANVAANYDTNAQPRLVTFLDNHDNARFLNTGTTNRLAVALVFLYTARGVPCLYYGTEQAFNGATDPYDREDMFAGQFKDAGLAGVDSFNMTHPLFQFVAQLNNFRRLYPALSLGTHVNQWNNAAGPGLFAYSRVLNTQEVFVVFNTATASQTLPGRTVTYPAGTVLANLLNPGETITVLTGSQTPGITVPATTAKIFIAQSQVLALDPVVTGSSPGHAAKSVSPVAPVVLQFSKPMNPGSVQAAFATVPPVTGVFSWSTLGDTVTFTPAGSGFAPLTNITVTVSNTAFDRISTNTMVAPYQFFFQTTSAPPVLFFSSPANPGTVVPLGNNTTYLIQACFTPTLATNDTSLFSLTVNGVLQPRASYLLKNVGIVAGCTGMRSLLYNWTTSSPGTMTGTNFLQIVYANTNTGVMLTNALTVLVPPVPVISGLTGNFQSVVWSSTPGVNYLVLATTNLSAPFAPISGIISASGWSTSYLDVSNAPPAPQKFYEIEIAP